MNYRLLILCCIGFGVLPPRDQPEKFRPGAYEVKTTRHRVDPHPKWVSVAWKEGLDSDYTAIRREIAKALSDHKAKDTSGHWAAKTRRAFEEWYEDCQNPFKLYRVTALIGATLVLDPDFKKTSDYFRIRNLVNTGWAILKKPPHSYEFVRRGYIFNSGDSDFHIFGDLPQRLLARNPRDRSVVIAMIYEYVWRKPIPAFEQVLFAAIERTSSTEDWRPWDNYHWAVALRMYGRKHQKKESYNAAIAKAQKGIDLTPEGWDAAWIGKWIEETKLEREDPSFGFLKGGRYIDDLDPP